MLLDRSVVRCVVVLKLSVSTSCQAYSIDLVVSKSLRVPDVPISKRIALIGL